MSFYIPVWVLWTVGLFIIIPLIAFILFLAFLGWQFGKMLSKGLWYK